MRNYDTVSTCTRASSIIFSNYPYVFIKALHVRYHWRMVVKWYVVITLNLMSLAMLDLIRHIKLNISHVIRHIPQLRYPHEGDHVR